MATINVNLYCLWQHGRFVTAVAGDGIGNHADAALPPIVAGDTWQIKCYFVDDGHSDIPHRFAGSTVSARIRAAGNNHGYADAPASGEFPSNVTPAITRTQAGAAHQVEIQRVVFPVSYPIQGNYTIIFTGAGSGGRGGGFSLEGNLTPANNIGDGMRAMSGYFKGNDGPHSMDELRQRYGGAGLDPIVTGSFPDFSIQFGNLYGGANYWNTGIHLVEIDDSRLTYYYGWDITLPFTASDFTDYLIPANGPAFFEVMLDGQVAAQRQLTAGPVGNTAPAFTSAPPPDGGVGVNYTHVFKASGFPNPTFSLTSGTLPDGLTLDADGTLHGILASGGTFSGVVTATNAAGSVTQNFTIHVSVIIIIDPGGGPPGGGAPPGNIAGIRYDGDHSGAWAIGVMRRESPFKSSPGYYIYRQRWRAMRPNSGALPLGSVCPDDPNAGLVEETERQDVGGADLVDWDKVWANVPSIPDEFEVFNYPYQQLYQFPNGAWAVFSMILVRTSRVNRTFINTENPAGISLDRLPRAIMFNNTPNPFDGFVNVTNGSTVIAADDTLERWMGNIWVKTHRTVRI